MFIYFAPVSLISGNVILKKKIQNIGGKSQHIKIFIAALFIAKIKCIYIYRNKHPTRKCHAAIF